MVKMIIQLGDNHFVLLGAYNHLIVPILYSMGKKGC